MHSSIVKEKILGSRYKVLKYIAEGGFGTTFLAEDTQLPGKDRCVVKQLSFSIEAPQVMSVARRLFEAEALALHSLGHHEQIPELLAYFEEEGKFYLVQQYIDGQTIEDELATGRVWSQEQVVELLRDGLEVLEFIHSQGIIHRDIKPDNLIRRHSDGKIVLVDFGTVKKVLQKQFAGDQLTIAVGTKGYMPMEQAQGKPLPVSDLYALGVIAIQALTQVEPLDLEEQDGELVWTHLAEVDSKLAEILTKMTRYRDHDRYQSARQALQTLNDFANGTTDPREIVASQPVSSAEDTIQLPTATAVTPATNNLEVAPLPTNIQHQSLPQRSKTDFSPGVTPINSAVDNFPTQSKTSLWAIAIALVITIAGGIYLFMSQSTQSPSDTPVSPNLPDSSTPRIRQGDGFRRDL